VFVQKDAVLSITKKKNSITPERDGLFGLLAPISASW
jgi:hypothetical protein